MVLSKLRQRRGWIVRAALAAMLFTWANTPRPLVFLGPPLLSLLS